MSVELSYRVVHLARIGPSVKMVLQEVRTVPPEEIERARLESEQEPETDIVVESEQLVVVPGRHILGNPDNDSPSPSAD